MELSDEYEEMPMEFQNVVSKSHANLEKVMEFYAAHIIKGEKLANTNSRWR